MIAGVRARPDGGTDRTLHVIQGEFRISDEPDLVLATILGSCVAACMRDPIAGVGGLNHFLLPGSSGQAANGAAERYGVHAMELLVNGLLSRGAQRHRLEVKLFGGAATVSGLSDVGAQNAAFAREFVRLERLTLVGECLGGGRGRRLQFWPVSGRARRIFLAASEQVVEKPVVPEPEAPRYGSVELF